MEDPREALAHVLWIGGGPQSGKTTLSRLLAGKWDLKIYKADWRGANEHSQRPGPAEQAFLQLTLDERWAVPSVAELVDRSITIYGERFAKILEHLRQLPRSRVIVAEGPGVLPWNVASVVKSPRQAVFLVPNGDWRDGVELRRFGAGQAKRFPGIVERERALAKVDERDALIDERIQRSCTELGLRCLFVDGSLDLDDSLALLEEHFQPHLPAVPNV